MWNFCLTLGSFLCLNCSLWAIYNLFRFLWKIKNALLYVIYILSRIHLMYTYDADKLRHEREDRKNWFLCNLLSGFCSVYSFIFQLIENVGKYIQNKSHTGATQLFLYFNFFNAHTLFLRTRSSPLCPNLYYLLCFSVIPLVEVLQLASWCYCLSLLNQSTFL